MARSKQQKRKQETGLVEVKKTIGKTMDGKLIRKSFYGSTRKQALEKADNYLLKVKTFDGLQQIPFTQVAEQWLSAYKEDAVRTITYERSYQAPYQKHILPYFKSANLSDIKQKDIQFFLNNKSNYSYSSLQKMRTVLYGIFEYAIANDYCYKNPVKGTQLARRSTDRAGEKRAYTYQQALKVISLAQNIKNGSDIIILLKTGLRRSELLALRWENIDMEKKIIHVRESVSETGTGLEIHPCKSIKSIRDIPFDDELHAIFSKMQRSGFVIKGQNGKNVNPHNWSYKRYVVANKKIQEAAEMAGMSLPLLNPHEMRHTFGSILYERGVDIVTISKLMGHSSIEITVKLYVHDSLEKKMEAIQKLS